LKLPYEIRVFRIFVGIFLRRPGLEAEKIRLRAPSFRLTHVLPISKCGLSDKNGKRPPVRDFTGMGRNAGETFRN
jgi:hypothetical protein